MRIFAIRDLQIAQLEITFAAVVRVQLPFAHCSVAESLQRNHPANLPTQRTKRKSKNVSGFAVQEPGSALFAIKARSSLLP